MQKEVATFFISLFVHVTLSKLIRVVYPEENNDLNQLWEQQSVNQLFRGFPLGRLLEHKEKLRIKQVLSRNDKCSLFPVPQQELRFKRVRNTEWGNWELVTNCWGFFWTAALWGNSLQELSQGTAIPQRWTAGFPEVCAALAALERIPARPHRVGGVHRDAGPGCDWGSSELSFIRVRQKRWKCLFAKSRAAKVYKDPDTRNEGNGINLCFQSGPNPAKSAGSDLW